MTRSRLVLLFAFALAFALAPALAPPAGAASAQGVATSWRETLTIDSGNSHPAKAFEAFDTASLNLYDFNGDGQMEIVSNNDNNHFYVLDSRTGAVLFEGVTPHPGGNAWPVRDINPIAIGNLMGDGRACMVVPSDAARIAAWCYNAGASTATAFNFTKEWDVSIDASQYEPDFQANHPWLYAANGTILPQYSVGSDGDAFMASVDASCAASASSAGACGVDGSGCKYVYAETDGWPGQLAFDCHGNYKWSVSWFDGNAGATVVDFDHDGKKDACFASDAGEIACYDAKSGAIKWIFRARENGAFPASVPVAPGYADIYGNGQVYTFFGARNAVYSDGSTTIPSPKDPAYDANWMNETHAVWYELDPNGRMMWNVSYDWMNPVQYDHPAAVDVNGDGVLDWVALDWNTIGHKPGNWEPTDRSSNLFALDGRDGSVLWRTPVPIYWSNKDFVIADADGDGKMDVIVDEPKLGLDGLGVYDLYSGKNKGWFPFNDAWGTDRGPVAGDLYGDGQLYLVVPAAHSLSQPNYRSLDVGYREGELHVVATGQRYNVAFSANFLLSDDQRETQQHGSGAVTPPSVPTSPTPTSTTPPTPNASTSTTTTTSSSTPLHKPYTPSNGPPSSSSPPSEARSRVPGVGAVGIAATAGVAAAVAARRRRGRT